MPPLVLIHGLFGHLDVPEIHAALEEIETLAPDLIGYGELRDVDTRALTLERQADHVIERIEARGARPVHLLGHSVGGAIAMRVAAKRADLLASLTSVEGNFTLADAFWSERIAAKTDAEVEEIMSGYRRDPDAWMAGAVGKRTELTGRLAREWLDHQPASTIKRQARAVVDATGTDDYRRGVREVLESTLPVHLVAGTRSAASWDVPDWANDLCASRVNIADTGHLMMIERPRAFARAVRVGIDLDAGTDRV